MFLDNQNLLYNVNIDKLSKSNLYGRMINFSRDSMICLNGTLM